MKIINTKELRIGNLIQTDEYIIKKNIRYIHRLQNLYFTLTGQELI